MTAAEDSRDLVEPQPPSEPNPEFNLDEEAPDFWEREREKSLCMVALGGNAISSPDSDGTFQAQMSAVENTAKEIVEVMKAGFKVVLTHGNGPQVGSLLLQQEQGDLPAQPLEVCGAMSQGQIGYMFSQQMYRQLETNWKHVPVAAIITQTIIDPDDPAFDDPTKPVGPFYSADQVEQLREQGMTIKKVRDTGDRDYRRVVPSPEPQGIVEETPVKRLIGKRDLVITGGGGGVPVSRAEGYIDGHDAVVDKDLLANVIGHRLDADYLLIITDVEGVYRDYGTPDEAFIDKITAEELEQLHASGEFPEGSMGPKVDAAYRFVRADSERDREAIITSLENAKTALTEGAGTHVVEST
ncbi:MAG: carbamate kinase [Halodesulfurarchaeum sp.]